MFSTTIQILTITLLLLAMCNAKTVSSEHDHFEMTGENASAFLHTSTEEHQPSVFDKRESGTNCVPCKFGINPCCDPNICQKKTFWFDECLEIKQAKHFDRTN